MNILVLGGTRFFGIHMVDELLKCGHEVTIATRGLTPDEYGEKIKRIVLERTNEQSVKRALQGKYYDLVIDMVAYCSNDIRCTMDVLDCERYILMSSTAVYAPKHADTAEWEFDAGAEREDRNNGCYQLTRRRSAI